MRGDIAGPLRYDLPVLVDRARLVSIFGERFGQADLARQIGEIRAP